MVGKSERFSSRYSCCVRQSAENMDSSDKLPGTSGRVDIDDSCLPRSKPISLDIDRSVLDGIRVVHIPVSRMSSPDKRRLVTQLKTELQKIDKWQKKITKATTFGHCVKLSPTVQTPQMKCGNAEPEQILKNPKETRKRAIDEVYVSPCTGDQGEKHAHLLQTPQLKSANAGKFEIKKQILPTKATNRFDLIMNDCKKLNSCLMSQNDSWVFNESVDPVKLKLPDYFDIIKHPMDLGTIQTKLSSGAYMSPLEFMHDVRLTFSNAMTYNLPENIVHNMAIRMSNFFEIRWKCIEKKLAAFDQGNKISKPESQSKKLKTLAIPTIAVPVILERKKQHMTIKNKQRLSQVIQTWIAEIPENVVDFLKSRNANQISEDELEIDLETLDDEALSELQELMVEFVKLRTNKEIDTTNYETEGGLFQALNSSHQSNSRLHPFRGSASSSGNDSNVVKASQPKNNVKQCQITRVKSTLDRERTDMMNRVDINGWKKDNTEHFKVASFGEGTSSSVKDVSPSKRSRYNILIHRYAGTIQKAQDHTINSTDPELFLGKRVENKATPLAEAYPTNLKAGLTAAKAALERKNAKKEVNLKRVAAREAMLKMEKTVDLNDGNNDYFKDLEMFSYGNHLERLGLFIKKEKDEDEDSDKEEGEID